MTARKVCAIFFIGFLCIALLLSSGQAAETRVYQGPCSDFPDCNRTCIERKFPEGGKCVKPGRDVIVFEVKLRKRGSIKGLVLISQTAIELALKENFLKVENVLNQAAVRLLLAAA
ncbi:unnamed protein product [Ilex paraguariensis]|uniref:Uncharacterized protein n=1 Tax=Ilex paraguariensis TaxID=185542 RepID=A0ABC8T226_9AQUA